MTFRPVLLLTAFALLALGACASSRSLDQSFSDLSGDVELKNVLFEDRSHDYGDIDTTLYEGRLLLTGTMRSEAGRRKLIENAWKAENIDAVIDEVVIGEKTSFGQGFEDGRIDKVLRARLIAHGDVSSVEYKIAVSGAVVYLIGAARNQKELDTVLAMARSIAGVEKVVSHVIVKDVTR